MIGSSASRNELWHRRVGRTGGNRANRGRLGSGRRFYGLSCKEETRSTWAYPVHYRPALACSILSTPPPLNSPCGKRFAFLFDRPVAPCAMPKSKDGYKPTARVYLIHNPVTSEEPISNFSSGVLRANRAGLRLT